MSTSLRAISGIPALFCGLAFAQAADAAIYTVTNTDDNGTGSLRQALVNSQQAPGIDEIRFAIDGTGPFVLKPLTRFTITEPVIIDGYTQAGAQRNTATVGTNALLQIVIDGSQVATESGKDTVVELTGSSTGSMITGLVFVNHRDSAVTVTTQSDQNHFIGNFFGIQADGRTLAVGQTALEIYSAENAIGGDAPADRNLMVSSRGSLQLRGSYNAVQGNLIGVDRDETPLPQLPAASVVVIHPGAGHNRIGDYGSNLPNVLGSSRSFAVILSGSAGNGNQIAAAKFVGDANLLFTNSVDDPGDADDGPNERMNRPVLDSAVVDGAGTLHVLGQLDSTPNREFRIALYGDRNGCGNQFVYYLGHVTINSDANGHASFDWSVALGERKVGAVFATAGADAGNIDSTSDFSACKPTLVPTYTVSTQIGQGGRIEPQGTSFVVSRAATQTFLMVPSAGYKFDQASGCPGTFSDSTHFVAGPIFADCTLTVRFGTIEPRLSPTSIPAARVGEDYRQTFVASGGYPASHDPAYIFSTTAAVPGLTFNQASGDTYVAEGRFTKVGRHVFDVVVKDDHAQTYALTYLLTVAKGAQTIDFPPMADLPFPTPPFEPRVSASSGLAVSLTSASPGVCSVSNGNRVTVLRPGTCFLVASQTGNDDYEPAFAVTRGFMASAGGLFYDGFE
jgi:hypothetical protein